MSHGVADEPLLFVGRASDPALAKLERQLGMILCDVADVIRDAAAYV